jgi:hypothetical protein
VPRRAPLVGGDVGDAGHGQQEDPAGHEDPLQRPQRRHVVEDEVQRLGQHDAVERGVRQHRPVGEVADERHAGGGGVDVQHVGLRHARAAEPVGVGGVADLEHSPPDVVGVAGEEALDVVAVDRSATGVAEVGRDRRGPPEVAEVHVAGRRRDASSGEPQRGVAHTQRHDPSGQLAELVHRPHLAGVMVMPSTAGTTRSWQSTVAPIAVTASSSNAAVTSFPNGSTSTR